MSVRIDQQPAYVLHRRAYRETSLLLDLLTRDHGRVAVVARAARSGTRAWGAFCQPFQSLLVSWTGRSELKSLTAAERAGDATAILGERLYSALYVNELLVRLLQPFDTHQPLFDAYARLLPTIAFGADIEPPLRGFEMLLLRELGYGLELGREALSGCVLEPQAHYLYLPGEGLSRAAASEESNAYPGWVLDAIRCDDYADTRTRRAAKHLLRQALAGILGDKPLRSREYFMPRQRNGGI